jgi:hypothetical protein
MRLSLSTKIALLSNLDNRAEIISEYTFELRKLYNFGIAIISY